MPETDKYKVVENQNLVITLDDAQQEELKKTIKCGVYKELHKRDILSDAELNSLLERNF